MSGSEAPRTRKRGLGPQKEASDPKTRPPFQGRRAALRLDLRRLKSFKPLLDFIRKSFKPPNLCPGPKPEKEASGLLFGGPRPPFRASDPRLKLFKPLLDFIRKSFKPRNLCPGPIRLGPQKGGLGLQNEASFLGSPRRAPAGPDEAKILQTSIRFH